MKSKQHNIRLKSIIFIILALILSFGIINSAAYARFNGGGDDTDPATGKYKGGPMAARTGWLVYLVDESGALHSDVVYASVNGKGSGQAFLKTRCNGASASRATSRVPWEPKTPYGTNGEGYGEQVRAYFLANEATHAKELVAAYWGEAKWDEVIEKDYKIIMEGVYWAHINGGWFNGTDWGWGQYLQSKNGPQFGPGWAKKYTNRIYPICCRFNTSEVGLTAMTTPNAGSYYTNSAQATRTNALGILLIDPNNDLIHTYWEPNNSPGNPEPAKPNKTGKYNIVKAYHTVKMKNGAIISDEHDLTTTTASCIPDISVDDEPNEYRLEYWTSDSDYNPGIEKPSGFIFFAWNYDCMKLRVI